MPDPASAPRLPDPPAEFLATLTDVSDRAAAGYGWQHGYLAGLAAASTPDAALPFDPVRAPAAVAKVYALAVVDEVRNALAQIERNLDADLSGPHPFRQLLAAGQAREEHAGGQRYARRKDDAG